MRSQVVSVLVLAVASAVAQTPEFAAPVRLKAGDKLLGEGRLFPSPVYQDVNGDGLRDVVVGDLVGHLTVALREPGAAAKFMAETEMLGADGKAIDFHNW